MENITPKAAAERVLRRVEKPGRYTGGEYGQIVKDKNSVRARFAFCFPDTYEIGMSNLGIRILYGAINANEDLACERAYTPWVDMEEQLRKYNIRFMLMRAATHFAILTLWALPCSMSFAIQMC